MTRSGIAHKGKKTLLSLLSHRRCVCKQQDTRSSLLLDPQSRILFVIPCLLFSIFRGVCGFLPGDTRLFASLCSFIPAHTVSDTVCVLVRHPAPFLIEECYFCDESNRQWQHPFLHNTKSVKYRLPNNTEARKQSNCFHNPGQPISGR